MISIPLIVLGVAGSRDDIAQLFRECGVVGAAAGSFFVFKGKYRAVFNSYPSVERKDAIAASVRSFSAMKT